MKRNVLLTTMSTLPYRMDVHYYFDEKTKKYCEGLVQTEAGTKLILCGDEKIDDIVVIGSEETYKTGTAGSEGDNINKVKLVDYFSEHSSDDMSKASPYALYRYRIGKYLTEGDSKEPNVMTEESRAAELREYVDKLMQGNGHKDETQWFDIIAEDERDNNKDTQKGLCGEINKKYRLGSEENAYIKSYLFSLVPDSKRLISRRDLADLTICFVPERVFDDTGKPYDNISEILSAIRNDGDEVNLYVDMQGGGRTDGYVRNAILTILTGEKERNFNLVKVVATNFQGPYWTNTIIDETERYMITDLVAAMNAFTQYGKADLIKKYCDRMYKGDNHIQKLVNEMKRIDMALSICDIDAFTGALIRLHEQFDDRSSDPVFSLMERLITAEYNGILGADRTTINYTNMCRWARDKGFIQQALTIIESKSPKEIVQNGICYYDEKKAGLYFRSVGDKLEEKDKYLLNDLPHLYLQRLILKEDKQDRIDAETMAGKMTLANTDTMTNILKKYKDAKKKRNDLNHAKGNPNKDIKASYDGCVKIIDEFLKLYKKALREIRAKGKNPEIKIFTKEELGFGDTKKTKTKPKVFKK